MEGFRKVSQEPREGRVSVQRYPCRPKAREAKHIIVEGKERGAPIN